MGRSAVRVAKLATAPTGLMIGNKANKAIEKTAMSALTFHKRNATGCLSQRENYIECRARQCPMAM
ncbi:hypothetical protein I070019H7_03770 [Bifidobacterium longum]|nr:hypothetical protein MCC01976_11840 [Bifidobacteriaceae bacterium MCC01976]GDZ21643.1 hypothetical protein MCC01977_00470 [Bifidobacteriaceae bacterium MCC01977]